MFQIDVDIEMPRGRSKYPFDDMRVGDSILFVEVKQANSGRVSAMRFVRAHAREWAFQMRRVDNGWRLWRIT